MRDYKKILSPFILCLTLLITSHFNSQAQTISPLFIPISKDSSIVDSTQSNTYNEFALDTNVVYKQFVKIGNVQSFLVDSIVTFTFPPVNAILTAKTNYTTNSEEEGSVWNGVFPNGDGDVTIITEGTERHGNLTYKNHYYSFESSGSLSLIKEIVTPEGRAFDINRDIINPPSVVEAPLVSCNNTIKYNVDILFFYTEKVGSLTNAKKIADNIIKEMNLISTNSAANCTFTKIDVMAMPIPQLDKLPTNPPFFEVGTLSSLANFASKNETVKSIRESKGADIVFILYGGPTKQLTVKGAYAGEYFGGETDFPETKAGSYFLIHKDYVINSKYQIAMIAGARSLGAGSEFLTGKYPDSKPNIYNSKYTIVHQGVPLNKSKYISNPKVLDGGVATGVLNQKDNVKAINNSVCIVANYFDSKNPASSKIFLSGGKSCIGKPVGVWLNNIGYKVTSSTLYGFSYSTDGSYYSPVVYQNSVFYTIPGVKNVNAVYVRVVFVDIEGYPKTTDLKINLGNCLDDDPTTNKQIKLTNIQDIVLSPNPAKEDFKVMIKGFKNKNLVLNILDGKSSKIIKSKNIMIEEEESAAFFTTDGLMSGMYYVQLISDEINITKPIIIINE